jgi:hypothetical protein
MLWLELQLHPAAPDPGITSLAGHLRHNAGSSTAYLPSKTPSAGMLMPVPLPGAAAAPLPPHSCYSWGLLLQTCLLHPHP